MAVPTTTMTTKMTTTAKKKKTAKTATKFSEKKFELKTKKEETNLPNSEILTE